MNYRGRTLLLKTPHTSVGGHGNIRVGVDLGVPALLAGFSHVEKQYVAGEGGEMTVANSPALYGPASSTTHMH